MPGVLLDLRIGDPILEDGDFVQLDKNYAFYQIITNLLNCQVGSEIWNQAYGFDAEEALRMHTRGAPEKIIESLMADALDPKKELLIFTVDYITAIRDGQEINIKFSVQSRMGTLVQSELSLNDVVVD